MASNSKKYIYIKNRGKILKREFEGNGFVCENCKKWVEFSKSMGTKNRNHCQFCLWSKHVDLKYSGDRNSNCEGLMEPLGITLKHEGFDKWGNVRKGELMLVHKCVECGNISINRIAGDDSVNQIMLIYKKSFDSKSELENLQKKNIDLMTKYDEDEIMRQLFGDDSNLNLRVG